MGPDEKHRNKGAQLEHDLNSLFFENEDECWPAGWWNNTDEGEEQSGNKNTEREHNK